MSGRKVLSLFIAACAAAALAAQASSPGRCGAARVDGAAIATVHVVSACHLDVGFRYMAPQIVNLWWHTHFPDVIKVAAELEARNQSAAALIFTAQSWVVWLYLNCPAGNTMELQCPNATQVQAVRGAIERGVLTWHAFPFNSEMELYAPEFVREGIRLSHELDSQFGLPPKVTMSQRDVPGTTRSLIPLLLSEGVVALSVGVNGASAAPDVPCGPFRWQDPNSGSDILAWWHPGGYGGIDPKSIVTAPGLQSALAMSWNGDNAGPFNATEIEGQWKTLAAQFPNARIIASTFDAFTAELQSVRDALPVFTAEVGDTWIYGVPSDPKKSAQMRAMNRAWTQYAQEVPAARRQDDPVYVNATRLALKAGEHTWGLDVKSYLKDDLNWTNELFDRAAVDPGVRDEYSVMTDSWARQRDWGVNIPLATLQKSKHPLGAMVAEEFAELTPKRPLMPADGFVQMPDPGAVVDTGAFSVALDNVTGAIVKLTDTSSGFEWASPTRPLAAPTYETYDQADINGFLAEYLRIQPPPSWAFHDFGKPNVSVASPLHQVITSEVKTAWIKQEKPGAAAELLVQLTFSDPSAHTDYGAFEAMWLAVSVPATAGQAINISLSGFNKAATRLPEATFLRFQPAGGTSAEVWQLNKLGEWIDAANVVDNGAKHLHAVQDGFKVYPLGVASNRSLLISPLDSPVVAVGKPNGWPTPLNGTVDSASFGVSAVLHDNLWGTNYVMWAGASPGAPNWQDNTDLLFRFSVVCK